VWLSLALPVRGSLACLWRREDRAGRIFLGRTLPENRFGHYKFAGGYDDCLFL
jgi:hypothetical protein